MAYTFARIVKLLIFYIVFYTVLVIFSGLCFFIFLRTVDDKVPKYQLEQSLIGTNPGVTFRPMAFDNVIRYKAGNLSKHWIDQLNEFLEPYNPDITRSENVQNCNDLSGPDFDKVCDFKLTSRFAPCLPQYNYGFDSTDRGPCVFLKLNRILGWVPDFYHRDNVPPEMPSHLVEEIKSAELRNEQYKVWVDCLPLDPSNAENMSIEYYPLNGFDRKYFPYTNVEGYLSPLVAVNFVKPKHGVLIKIECKFWANNIQHDRQSGKGVLRFGIFID